MKEQQIVTIYTFKTTPETVRDNFLDANQKLTKFLAEQPGFHYRSVGQESKSEYWVDVVYWESASAANHANCELMSSPCSQEFMKMVDHDSLKVQRIKVDLSSCQLQETA